MKLLMVVTACFIFTGCAGMDDDFSCKKTAKDACLSMTEANAMAARGGDLDQYMAEKKNTTPAVKAVPTTTRTTNTVSSSLLSTPALEELDPLNTRPMTRSAEQKTKLWVAPYADRQGVYHHASVIEFVTADSHWDK